MVFGPTLVRGCGLSIRNNKGCAACCGDFNCAGRSNILGNAGFRHCAVRDGISCGGKVMGLNAGVVLRCSGSGPLFDRVHKNVIKRALRSIPALSECSDDHINKCNKLCNSIIGLHGPLNAYSSGILNHGDSGTGICTGICFSVRPVGKLGCGVGFAPSFRFCHCGRGGNLCSFKLSGGNVARSARQRAHAEGLLVRRLLAFSERFNTRGVSLLTNCSCRSAGCQCLDN